VEKLFAPETFALFLAFFVPGFVMSTIWGLIVPTERIDFGKDLPRLVGYSALHYAATLWLVLLAPTGSARLCVAYVVVLALPVLWPPLLVMLRDPHRWRPRLTTDEILNYLVKLQRRPWDDVLDRLADNGGCWVRIRLKSGRWIGGLLGSGSRYSVHPDAEQLYLPEEIRFNDDGDAVDLAPNTKGIFVAGSEIEYLEFST
jgi:hypothetical protein